MSIPGADGSLFLPAVCGDIAVISGTWTKTRTAVGNYNLVRTAGSSSSTLAVNLAQVFGRLNDPESPSNPGNPGNQYPMPPGLGGSTDNGQTSAAVLAITNTPSVVSATGGSRNNLRGFRLNSVDVIYSIATADLAAAHSLAVETVTLATGSAPTVVENTAAAAIGLAQTTNVTVKNMVLTTPLLLGNNRPDVLDTMELVVNDTGGGTSAYVLYGFNLYFRYAGI